MTAPKKPTRITMWVARDSAGRYLTNNSPESFIDYRGERMFHTSWGESITKKKVVLLLGRDIELGTCEPVELEVIRD